MTLHCRLTLWPNKQSTVHTAMLRFTTALPLPTAMVALVWQALEIDACLFAQLQGQLNGGGASRVRARS